VARRTRVARSDSGAGERLALRRLARMYVSMGLPVAMVGGVSRRGWKAQWRRSPVVYVPRGATESSGEAAESIRLIPQLAVSCCVFVHYEDINYEALLHGVSQSRKRWGHWMTGPLFAAVGFCGHAGSLDVEVECYQAMIDRFLSHCTLKSRHNLVVLNQHNIPRGSGLYSCFQF